MATRFKLRRDTLANWQAADPVLLDGEPGYETDTHTLRMGDGVTPFTELPEFIDKASADARYAALGTPATPRSSSVAALGDSITSYNKGSSITTQNPGWFWRLLAYSRGRMYPEPGGALYATAGFTCSQILATHVPEIEALASPPGFVFIAGGANDISASGGLTYLNDPSIAEHAHQEIITRVQALGAVPILVKVPPNSSGAQISANVLAWNAYIDNLGKSRSLPVLDMYSALAADGTGGAWKTGANQDTTHPSALGHDYIAKYAIGNGILDPFPSLPSHSAPTWYGQLITEAHGRFLADANADGLADGWTTGGVVTGVTFAREAAVPGDGALGYWQVINIPANPSAGGWIQRGAITTGWAAGDRVRLRMLIQVTGMTGAATLANGLSPALAFFSPQVSGGWAGWFHDVTDGMLDVTMEAPAASTQLYIRVAWNGGTPNPVKVRIANVRCENLDSEPT